ncbi:adenylyltransferase/sulfurtransferase [Yimella lutea]|uniref:Adenylyltransferase/sulfurtransferase n=1 Tax=Yimella lutea TaxID=587872 RepID=A0A542EEN0_9MICO|nr:molybdopterin-synthase adenylyltransferase MoeB [Yimella lutea]TQJ13793.1 adenylyltransferase/sulfurtransferase [Yimella lutea]
MDGEASEQGRSQVVNPVGVLDDDQVRRYARHLSLPSVGPAGQRRLLDARVLVIGAGGLGAPVLQYLAAAGVGTITVVDDDEVDLSNLQRQVIHRTGDVGTAKVDSAARAVGELNPDVRIVAVRERLDAANVVDLCSDHDVVVDATDNFGTRFLLNDACVLLGLPLVWAAINQFDGQLTVWSAGEGPCLRCLFPVMPDPAAAPSCAAAGVLGVLPGLLGAAQASEALKLVLGLGDPLVGRIAVFDALAFEWSQIPVAADPSCLVCGPDAVPIDIRDEDPASSTDRVEVVPMVDAVEAGRLLASGAVRLVDVRSAQEWEQASVAGSQWLPLDDIRQGAAPEADGLPLVMMCRSGVRSAEATRLLLERGIDARSLDGGILAWAAAVDPALDPA